MPNTNSKVAITSFFMEEEADECRWVDDDCRCTEEELFLEELEANNLSVLID